MIKSKKLISSWKTISYIEMSALKKQFFRSWLINAIQFLRVVYTRKFIMEKELKYFSFDFKKN